jgi:hypothetical protein
MDDEDEQDNDETMSPPPENGDLPQLLMTLSLFKNMMKTGKAFVDNGKNEFQGLTEKIKTLSQIESVSAIKYIDNVRRPQPRPSRIARVGPDTIAMPQNRIRIPLPRRDAVAAAVRPFII